MTQGFTINPSRYSFPVPISQGGTGRSTTNQNWILYSSSNNVIDGLSSIQRGLLGTTSGGVPTYLVAGQIYGTTTNNNASTGYMGEYVQSSVLQASFINTTTETFQDITTISLTAGDWDVWGNVCYDLSPTSDTPSLIAWSNTVSATEPNPTFLSLYDGASGNSITSASIPIIHTRYSLSTTTTIYLSGRVKYAFSAVVAYKIGGQIQARRVR